MSKNNVLSLLNYHIREIADEWDNCDVPDGQNVFWGEMFFDKIIHIDAYHFDIKNDGTPFSEHCDENHKTFGASISDGETRWCPTCYPDLTN